MKIAFHSSYLGYRGTEIALMDYAFGNSTLLGNKSFFLLPGSPDQGRHPVADRLREIAPLRFYRSSDERDAILREERADFFYCIKNGWNDGVVSRRFPTGIHAIFRESEFHGDVYAYVSPWLSRVMSHGKTPWVPHMVRLAEDTGNLRQELGIPRENFVFGRHGGDDSFDIPWVQRAVVETARQNRKIWFVFLNTRTFPGSHGLANVVFLPATADPGRKRRFLNSCDAMLHGRQRGETFGLSCLEFAVLGKPVLTYAASPERAHLEILGNAASPYADRKRLLEFLLDPASRLHASQGRYQAQGEDCLSLEPGSRKPAVASFADYRPDAVMGKFREVFLS